MILVRVDDPAGRKNMAGFAAYPDEYPQTLRPAGKRKANGQPVESGRPY